MAEMRAICGVVYYLMLRVTFVAVGRRPRGRRFARRIIIFASFSPNRIPAPARVKDVLTAGSMSRSGASMDASDFNFSSLRCCNRRTACWPCPASGTCHGLPSEEFVVKRLVARFLTDDSGATAVEYALLASLIAMAIIGGATALGTALSTKYQAIATSLN